LVGKVGVLAEKKPREVIGVRSAAEMWELMMRLVRAGLALMVKTFPGVEKGETGSTNVMDSNFESSAASSFISRSSHLDSEVQAEGLKRRLERPWRAGTSERRM
jgi:hypothetical protein